MTLLRSYPSRDVLDRPRTRAADTLVFLAAAVLLGVIVRVSWGIGVPFDEASAPAAVSTDPAQLPYYAARSLLRMFAALGLSLVFTFVVRHRGGTAAARAEGDAAGSGHPAVGADPRILVGDDHGLHRTVPRVCARTGVRVDLRDLHLAGLEYDLRVLSQSFQPTARPRRGRQELETLTLATILASGCAKRHDSPGLERHDEFWRRLVFLVASEALSVNNHHYALPGIGAYVAAATDDGDLGKVFIAIGVMVIMVVGVNVLFWRPLTAWAERFRIEESEAAEAPRSLVLNLLRRSHVPALMGRLFGWLVAPVDRLMAVFGLAEYPLRISPVRRRAGDVVFAVAVLAALVYGVFRLGAYINATAGFGEVAHALGLGLVTFGRVIVLVVGATLIWVPIGVWIGLNPKVSRLAQPVVQVLASFPANFLFPLATAVLVSTGISLNWGGIVLMSLGAQWYILFNVIAGASSVFNDLREAAANLQLSRSLWWRRLILPAIFPSYVTGGITAAGGAWNASIVAEVVSYGSITLVATGLGAYISQATSSGDSPRILIGVLVMSFYVVSLNRLFWRRLYALAQRRYSL